jgi:2',3'-cyclic-nucleotide 2'-phosphodiesterase (5'-nucleotidase family)
MGACTHYYTDARYDMQQVRIQDMQPDSSTAALISPYKMALDSEMHVIVCNVAMDLNRAKPESLLGNVICDILVAEAEQLTNKPVDFGVYNYGGIRQEFINKGPLTKGKVYELLPFENFGATVMMRGSEVTQLAQKIIDEGGWPVSSGIKIIVVNGKPSEILIKGEAVDQEKWYCVAMNDYMANGGDNLSFINKDQVTVLGTTIRDMFLHYASTLQLQQKELSSSIQGRIQYAD